MKITWREAEYDYYPLYIQGGTDKETNQSNIYAPIFGADTESVQLAGRYEPQCFTISDPYGKDRLVYLPEDDFSLYYFLEDFIYEYEYFFDQGIKQAFIYWHNLEYDWLQLIKNNQKLLEMARIGVGPSTDQHLFYVKGCQIQLGKNALFHGSAPHLTLIVKRSKRETLRIHFRDTFSYFPGSLAGLAEDLKLEVSKMDRQEDLGQTDYRNISDHHPHKQYFEDYAKLDARVTRLAAEKIRALHEDAKMKKIRVSAPSFAINRLYHMMGDTRTIRTGVEDPNIMQLIFDTYRGGRTGGIYHGAVDHLSVLDFHSSYPASMLSLPSFSPEMQYIRLDDLRIENVMILLQETGNAFLRVSGVEHDTEYPGLITTVNGKLTPVHGEFSNIATTGVELFTAYQSGTLEIKEIHECIVLVDFEDHPYLPFKEFATAAYKRKANSEKGSVEYASSKLDLNASYGKLIESRSQTLIGAVDSRALLPYLEGMETDFANYWYQKYLELIEAGRTLSDAYEELMGEIVENFDEETRAQMKTKMFGDLNISGRVYGRHVNPAAASLITATSRARLCAGMKALNALYWDTDSLFFFNLSEEEIQERLNQANQWLPNNVIPLRLGPALGELGFDIKDAKGFLAGTKRYYLKGLIEDPEGNWVPRYWNKKKEKWIEGMKTATHGIPALPKEETESILSSLATGENYEYTSKPKPLKSKEAKTAEEIGAFRSKSYITQFHLDPRLHWTKTESGWIGQIKSFAEQDAIPDLTDEQYEHYLQKLYQTEWIHTIREGIQRIGPIQTIRQGERFYGEYQALSTKVKRKYFRKNGKPIDTWSDEMGMRVIDVFDQLRGE